MANLLEDLERIRKNLISLQLESRPVESNIFLSSNAYKHVSVYPGARELTSPNHAKLPCNIIKGPYKDTYEYLSTHFSLLREDFLKPIRENVISYLDGGADQKLLSIKIHEVQVIRKGIKGSDICHCFEITKGVTYSTWNLKGGSKRFLRGSLLIFSKDNFKSCFCGRVADSRSILHKKVLVSFEAPLDIKKGQTYHMIECYTFFEPYFHVLKVLQAIPQRTLSMQKYLVEAKSSVAMPRYLNGIKTVVSSKQLNKSQLTAMNAALSQELVIIQGPPGTGKTFLGLKIAKMLLVISKKWYDESPMLIVSVTNHALDQFLEGLTGCTQEILRFGSQSKNRKMDNFSMRECRDRYYKSSPVAEKAKREMAPLFKAYCVIEKQIQSIGNQLDNIATNKPTCIFNFNLLATGVPEIKKIFSRTNHFFVSIPSEKVVSWLLEEDGTMGMKNGASTVQQDSETMAKVYGEYLKDSHKPSTYCVISVSIIENAAQKLLDRTIEMMKGLEKKKLKYGSDKTQRFLEVYLREKQTEIDKLNDIYAYLLRKARYLKLCLKTDFNNNVDRTKVDTRNPFNTPVNVRWQLYKHWLGSYETYLTDKMDSLIDEYEPVYEEFNEAQDKNNLNVMRRQKVIGMTTTSAARMHSTIRALQCPIVIVEEAAEALEAHIIPVLTEHCQHLILIGDHQQLKPSTADYDIETRQKLGVSLFERMVINDIQCHTLNVQHRMRPEISSLVTPSIYPILYNHESVEEFPKIDGVDKCLYFITHNEPEQDSGDSSKKNLHEAKFLIELAVYLLKNGYGPENITILTPYLGQVRALVREQSYSCNDKVKEVKITSVDNFQGEENTIILLSLVRNNPQKKIGFLSIENRVCVALSRAREGLYIMGNMRQLSSCSKLWEKIKLSLKAQKALGRYLPLKCQKHGEVTEVKNVEDFDMVPDGGCNKFCKEPLLCGHSCQRRCHNDDILHRNYKCTEPCARSACKNASHKCQKYCYQECGTCMYPLTETLPCGHHVKCFMEEMEDYRCVEVVYVRLPCGHKESRNCNDVDSEDSDAEDLDCSTCVEIKQKVREADKKVALEDVEYTRFVRALSEEEEEDESSDDSDFEDQ